MSDVESSDEPASVNKRALSQKEESLGETPAKRLRRSGRRGDTNVEPVEVEVKKVKKTPKPRKSKRTRGRKKATVEEEEDQEDDEEETVNLEAVMETEEPVEAEVPDNAEEIAPSDEAPVDASEDLPPTEEDDQDEPTVEEPIEEPIPIEDSELGEMGEGDDVKELEELNEVLNQDTTESKPTVAEHIQDCEDIKSPMDMEDDLNDLEHHDTEMVSEDELPSEGAKVPLDTEAVSDEELPGPTQAELLDTEAVSEDELPPVKKKRKRRHSSDSDKRTKTEADNDSSDGAVKKDKEIKTSSKSKALPELDKYWKAVKEDPSDFTGWTYLLQYVDQESDLDAAREAYDKFLQHYPYCYGYWRKYADYEKRKGGEVSRCEEVFERGLAAIPLSVDLWLHYLNFCKVTMKDDEEKLRAQFERALDECGLEFRSDRLWDCYIKWETELKNYSNAFKIYNRLLSTPTQGYKTHFESFEDFIRSHHPNKFVGVDEFLELRSDVLQKLKEKGVTVEPSAAPPGDDSEDEKDANNSQGDEELALMRDKLISSSKKFFKETVTEVVNRWNFEEGIKRPYFHVKPLERCQLNTWREYLDYEISAGSEKRTIILFERCLIACALYEEFWVKYIKYLETLPNKENDIRKVYYRACTVHHPRKPYLALNWASFEECQGNYVGARDVLIQIERELPSLMLIHLRRINLERRAGNLDEATKLFDCYLSCTKSRAVFITLSVKYSRFCWKVLNDVNKGIEVLQKAIEKNPDVFRLYVQLVDLHMLQSDLNVTDCVEVFDKVIERDMIDLEDKIIFAQRKIEFLEDFGADINSVQKAQQEYFQILKQLKEHRRNPKSDDKKSDDSKKGKIDQYSSYSNPPTSYSSSYQGSGQYSGQYSNASGQYSADQNSYQNWNYSQTNYSNGNQSWGGYNYYS